MVSFFLTEEEFHQAQRQRLCGSAMPAFAGAWVEAFWRELGKRFSGLPAQPSKMAVCEVFQRTPQDRVDQLFGALTKSVRECPPQNFDETDWVRELAAYAAMRSIDFSIWAQIPCWVGVDAGKEKAKTVDLPAVPDLLAHVALAGLQGRPWRLTEKQGVAGAIDLSRLDFGTGVEQEILCALYDEVACSEIDWPNRSTLKSELTRKEKAKLRQWIWEKQGYAGTTEDVRYFGVQISLALSTDAKQPVLRGVAHAIDALVLNVAPENSDSDAVLDDMVCIPGLSIEDVSERVRGILHGLRHFDKPAQETSGKDPEEKSPAHEYRWDVFMSHASQDKPTFVDGLVAELKENGWKVWYDKEQLKGDRSLGQGLEQGFKKSRHMVALISKDYLQKDWTIMELEAAQGADPSGKNGKLMVVRHKISYDELKQEKPFIANRLVLDSATMSYMQLVEALGDAMRRAAQNS